MTTEHPAKPLHELIYQWKASYLDAKCSLTDLLAQAYQAGADHELQACCEWLQDPDLNVDTYKLRAARRPKPPSLKEQALAILPERSSDSSFLTIHFKDVDTLRRALKAIPDD